MTLQQKLAPFFLSRLLANPRGRAFLLAQASDAEASDEGRIFEELLRRVDDPELQKLVRIHQADEERHAELFAEAAKRVGVTPPPLPAHLKLLNRLDTAMGGFFAAFEAGERGVMDVYLLLQVIEERAITQFRLIEPIMRKVDPAAADLLLQIARDEDRHLKYCRAISRRYAPDEATLARTLAELRDIEARAFGAHARANMRYCMDHELVSVGPIVKAMLRQLLGIGDRKQQPVPTPFHLAQPSI